MSIRAAVRQAIAGNRLGRSWLESRQREQRRRDWTAEHRETFGTTTLAMFTTVGIGDVMVARQVCQEFVRHCRTYGDPRLGNIVVAAGAWPMEFELPRGDHNVYWWWSMNGRDNWLERYLGRINVRPDVVACPSAWCLEQVRAAGLSALYLPLAAGPDFRPLGLDRAGIGYAGSRGHKDAEQVAALPGAFAGDAAFEWGSGFSTAAQINEFYNRKCIVLGMTERYQERAGMVNNRVFEVLASGTPFLIHRHRAIEELLGQSFPYQSENAGETRALAEDILADFPRHLERFEQYRRIVDAQHRYEHRVKGLFDYLGAAQLTAEPLRAPRVHAEKTKLTVETTEADRRGRQ